MNLRLSIIIPVYNTERWIARCLDSCLDQDIPHSDYEIIVVNDGTPDNAMHIVSRYASQYDNIRVVQQENGGLSAARNAGLSVAIGHYVWFVDSDDYIESNCLASLLTKACADNLDVLCFKPYLLFEDGGKTVFDIPFETDGKSYSGSDFVSSVAMPPAAWCALYMRQFLADAGLVFRVGIYHEDQEFTPRAYYLASRISYVDKCIYYYFQRTGSIMKSTNPKRASDLLVVADSLYDFLCSSVSPDSASYDAMLNKVSFAFAQSLRYCDAVERDIISEYESKPYYPLAINGSLSRKESLKYRLINTSIRLYLLIYKLFKI